MDARLILTGIEIAAVLTSAVGGMIVASRKGLDLVGTFSLAVVSAFGGGTLRDLLVDRRPFFWVAHWEYLVVILALSGGFVYSRRVHELARAGVKRAALVDALGLALFSLGGVAYAIDAGLPLPIAPLIGVVTGTAGGVLRDVLTVEVPELFRPGGLFAASSFAGCGLQVGLLAAGAPTFVSGLAGFITIAVLRFLALWRGLRMPDPIWLRPDRTPLFRRRLAGPVRRGRQDGVRSEQAGAVDDIPDRNRVPGGGDE